MEGLEVMVAVVGVGFGIIATIVALKLLIGRAAAATEGAIRERQRNKAQEQLFINKRLFDEGILNEDEYTEKVGELKATILDVRKAAGEQRRKCPFCAEWIKAEAIKCRFCGSEMPALPDRPSPAPPAVKRAVVGDKPGFYPPARNISEMQARQENLPICLNCANREDHLLTEDGCAIHGSCASWWNSCTSFKSRV